MLKLGATLVMMFEIIIINEAAFNLIQNLRSSSLQYKVRMYKNVIWEGVSELSTVKLILKD